MWGSIPALETLASIAFWVGVSAGGIALIAGAALTVTSDRIAALAKAEADIRISEADARAAEANARAEEARAEAARANERVEKAQEARKLSTSDMEALKPLLQSDWFQKNPKPTLRVSSVEDAEARMYATQWQDFLESCGVNVYPTDRGFPSTCVQHEPDENGLVLTVQSVAVTPESQPFTRFHQTIMALGLIHTVQVDSSLREREAVLHILRKPSA